MDQVPISQPQGISLQEINPRENKPQGSQPQEKEINVSISQEQQWFVLRDLTRPNAKRPAYLVLQERGVHIFTPMINKLKIRQHQRIRVQVPYIHDLVFAYGTRAEMDPLIEEIPTLQYRFLRHTYREPMTVRTRDMERFIGAVEASPDVRYYRPEDITPEMKKRKILIIGGNLHGYEGHLLTVRGSKTKRLVVEIPNLLAAAVEVQPEFIQLI